MQFFSQARNLGCKVDVFPSSKKKKKSMRKVNITNIKSNQRNY